MTLKFVTVYVAVIALHSTAISSSSIRGSSHRDGIDENIAIQQLRHLEDDQCPLSLYLLNASDDDKRLEELDGNGGTIRECQAESFGLEIEVDCSSFVYMALDSYDIATDTTHRYRLFKASGPYKLTGDTLGGGDGETKGIAPLKELGNEHKLVVYLSNREVHTFTFSTINCLGNVVDGGTNLGGGDVSGIITTYHDYRFSKISFVDGSNGPTELPLDSVDYPMDGSLAELLKLESNAHSVITMDDYELRDIDMNRYLDAAGGIPEYPNDDPDSQFWTHFRTVVNIQVQRRANANPSSVMTLPQLWRNFNIHEVAEAVHDEYPGFWPSRLLDFFFQIKVPIDYDILPFRSHRDFIGYEFRMADLNTWASAIVAPINFRAKWHVGFPRPEEIAWLIAQGIWTVEGHGVPSDIYDTIRSFNLRAATEFTAYQEGSPMHPSWPAMHSAASCTSLWMAVVFRLDRAQYCDALRMDYAVSFARTVAGVHYTPDNIGGLNMGQKILADNLADHLSHKYGSDRAKVQAKIDKYTFDWATYDPDSCPPLP